MADDWSRVPVYQITEESHFLTPHPYMSLKTLSKKLVLLLALTDASRCSELHALDLRDRVFKPEGVFFTLASLTKKRKSTQNPVFWCIPRE